MDDRTALAILRAQMRAGRTVRVTVRGISMEPTLHDGDVVSVSPVASFRAGEIAAFHYGHEGLLVHRILSIEGGYVHLRGDNAVRIEMVPVASLLGIVRLEESASSSGPGTMEPSGDRRSTS